MRELYCILIEADCGSTLGGSCTRDLYNTANYLYDKVEKLKTINILSTKKIENKDNFPSICEYDILKNFKKQTEDIIKNIPNNTTLFVMISGHGYQRVDKTNNEIDNMDEYIRTCNETIIDNDLWDIFIKSMNKNINFVGMCDTCHSGSMFDLDYEYENNKWITATKRQPIERNAISIGACRDNQMDNCIVGDTLGYGGALTIFIIC